MNAPTQAPGRTAALLNNNIERIVALAMPLVFTPAAILIAKWVTTIAPGTKLTPDQVTAVLVSAVVAVIAAGLKWLHGRQVLATKMAGSTAIGATHADLDRAIKKLYSQLTALPVTPAPTPVDGLSPVVIAPASPAPLGDWTAPELPPAVSVPAA